MCLPPEYVIQSEMQLQKNRQDSFRQWVFDDSKPCSAMKLAEAGFYSVATTDEPDSVQCFLCGKTLDGWEAEDDPWMEHLSHSKNCKFAQLQKPEESLTMAEFLDLIREQEKYIIDSFVSDCKKKHKEQLDDSLELLKKVMKKI